MACKNEGSRHSKFVIRIVCEGDKTEPLFFSDLCNTYFSDNNYVDIKTIPQPYVPDEDEDFSGQRRGWHKGKKRKVKKAHNDESGHIAISGQPPLKWVMYCRQILGEGVDEAWAVYDKDEHPKHKEAFEEAARIVDGKIVNIAFSSRSFEYYLLLHFEYINHPFKHTECGERIDGNKHIFECGTGKIPHKECNGRDCINGYARKKGYWQQSKSDISTFPLVKNQLIKGMINASRLRDESDSHTSAPIYERNPYTNVDKLVGRLIGKYMVPFGESFEVHESGQNFSLRLTEEGIEIENHNNRSEFFSKGRFAVYNWQTNQSRLLNDMPIIVDPNKKYLHYCNVENPHSVSIKISPEKELFLLPKFN